MSHFFVAVIIPPDAGEGKVSDLLAPYDENIHVAPRREKCWCVGQDAKQECEEAALLQLGYATWDALTEDYKERHPEAKGEFPLDDAAQFRWQQFIEPVSLIRELLLKYNPMAKKADKECECKGTGWTTTTYNPDSKWDWWVIGGRWDGVIKGDYSQTGFNFEEHHHQVDKNCVVVEDLLALTPDEFEKRMPFAVVCPEGIWYEKGTMGWWGMVKNPKAKDTWSKKVMSILKKFPGHKVVGCDLHI